MMSFSLSGGVEVYGFIAPTEITDEYPVIDPLYGIDGFRNVDTLNDLNNTPTLRRRAGMVVGIGGGTQYYKLNPGPWNGTISDWTIFNSGGGGGTFTGGTVTGPTIFTNGLTANTLTVNGVSITGDTYTTGGTYSNGTITFDYNTGGGYQVTGITDNNIYTTGFTYSANTFYITDTSGNTFSATIDVMTGLTINGNLNVTGTTSLQGFSATTISATTIGTSGNCVDDIYVSNIHSCSPLNINPLDEGNVYFGSTSGVTFDLINNKVGIGTSTPNTIFHVVGNYTGGTDALIPQMLFQNSNTIPNTNKTAIIRTSVGTGFNAGGYPEIWLESQETSTGVGLTKLRTVSNHPLLFYTNDIERARFGETGNFGINTQSPAGKLHVRTTTNQNIIFTSGTTGNQILSLVDGNVAYTGLTLDSLNLNLKTNGLDRVVVDSSGNVGIGTTTPTAKLHINNTTSGNTFLAEDSTNPDSTPFVIDVSGNTGIGTLFPTAKLDIRGNTILGTTTGDTTTFGNGIIFNYNVKPRIFAGDTIIYQSNNTSRQHYFVNDISSGLGGTIVEIGNGSGTLSTTTNNNFLNISGRLVSTSGANDSNAILISSQVGNGGTYSGVTRGLYYNPSIIGSGFTHRAIETTTGDVIFGSTSGNVGIGITNPTAKLHLSGNSIFEQSKLTINQKNSIIGIDIVNSGESMYQLTNSVTDWCIVGKTPSEFYFYNSLNVPIRFYTNASEKMTVLGNGNVGIGTSTPTEKLDVNGKTKTINLQVTSGATAGYVLTALDNSGNTQWVALGSNNNELDPVLTITGTTPSVVNIGDRFLISGGTGIWSGRTNQIAEYTGVTPTDYSYYIPVLDDVVFVTDTLTTYRFDGTNWISWRGTAILQNGNSLTTSVNIGTNNNQNLTLRTSGQTRVSIDTSGSTTLFGKTTLVQSQSSDYLVFSSSTLANSGQTMWIRQTAANTYAFGTNVLSTFMLVGPANVVDFAGQRIQTTGAAILSTVRLADPNIITLNGIPSGVTAGTQDFRGVLVNPTVNFGGTYSGNFIGYLHNPTITSMANGRHIAIQTVRGDVLFGTTSGNIGIGTTTPSAKLQVSGTTLLQTFTGTTGLISAATQNVLTIVGSGNTNSSPIFSVQGSQGELFSVSDSLTGSLFSVNDISGLPVLEVFSDNTTLMGSYLAPSLNTTARVIATTGTTNVYSIPTSAYTGAFFDYTVSDGTNLRAGNIMSIWSGASVNYTETQTTDFGNTSGLTFNMIVSSGNAILRTSGATGNWTVKTIVRSI